MRLSISNKNLLFGTHPSRSIGKMKILLPTPGKMIPIEVDVVEEYKALLIGIEKMEKYQFQPLVLENILKSKAEN